jgi:hypothetical protein
MHMDGQAALMLAWMSTARYFLYSYIIRRAQISRVNKFGLTRPPMVVTTNLLSSSHQHHSTFIVIQIIHRIVTSALSVHTPSLSPERSVIWEDHHLINHRPRSRIVVGIPIAAVSINGRLLARHLGKYSLPADLPVVEAIYPYRQ